MHVPLAKICSSLRSWGPAGRLEFAAVTMAAILVLTAGAGPGIATVATAASSRADAPVTAVAPDSAKLAPQLDAMFREAYPANEPGAAVIVVREDEVILRQGYGMADLELGVAMRPDMVFRLGSITKQFTAVAVMMLVQEGQIALDAPITTYLPDYPMQGHTITVEHLLTHTSGIANYTEIPEVMEDLAKDMSIDEMIATFRDIKLSFDPGTRYRYSNSGYYLLGAIIEQVTGQSYADFIDQRIFQPLAMKRSFYGEHARIIPGRVQGYEKERDTYVNATYLSMTRPYAAGALLSTVDDLARWDAALYTDRLLPAAARDRMWRSFTLADGSSAGYGYGWLVGTYDGEPLLVHGGGIHGFVTFALRMPERKIFVAVLSNNPAGSTPQLMAQKAVAAVCGDRVTWQRVELSPERLEKFVGVYRINEEETRVVTVEEGHLYTQRTGGSKNKAFPHGEKDFHYEHSLSHFWFEMDDGTQVTGMVMELFGGQQEKALRTDEPIPSGPAEVEVDPAIFASYVGVYELMPGFRVTVFREGDALMVQGTGQDAERVYAASETEFFLKVADVRFIFVVEPGADWASSLVVHQGSLEMTGKRVK